MTRVASNITSSSHNCLVQTTTAKSDVPNMPGISFTFLFSCITLHFTFWFISLKGLRWTRKMKSPLSNTGVRIPPFLWCFVSSPASLVYEMKHLHNYLWILLLPSPVWERKLHSLCENECIPRSLWFTTSKNVNIVDRGNKYRVYPLLGSLLLSLS